MNEKLNLVAILKDCPKGTKLYSPVWGEVDFEKILGHPYYAISINTRSGNKCLTKEGCYIIADDTECIIFPSKNQRDWSKFNVKKHRFDPKTFQPFDKVLVKRGDESYYVWFPDFVSLPPNDVDKTVFCMNTDDVVMAIPYNEETKHLVETNDEAPEFYRYWED